MRSRTEFLTAGLMIGAAAIALWPALAQRSPESILPPGFGQPAPANASGPKEPQPKEPARSQAGPTNLLPDSTTPPPATTGADNVSQADGVGDLLETDGNNSVSAVLAPPDLPPEARRPTNRVGLIDANDGGFGDAGFGASNGQFLGTVMREMGAPVASRWASILLRRALLSPSAVPAGVSGADWVAERVLLLVRMGEADMARALVARVDADNFTPRLYEAAMQAALATGDPASLCSIADAGADSSDEAAWPLAQAMCAGLSGEAGTASALVDAVRDDRVAGGIDVLLAEKVIGGATNTRRAVTIQWDGVDRLTAWRYGMAAATGVTIPPALFATVGPQVGAWQARAPLYDPAVRAGFAERATTLGVFSSAALVDFYAGIWDATDPAERGGSVGELLRTAYQGDGDTARVSAMRSLWDAGGGVDPYARELLTARAAALIPVGAASSAQDVDRLIGAMMSAGLDIQAARWDGRPARGSLGWALLAVGMPRAPSGIDAAAIGAVRGGDDDLRVKFLIAALAGLQRISGDDANTLSQSYAIPLGRVTSWTRAIDTAAARNEGATVALIAAAGLSANNWHAVPPEHLYHIVAALKRVGLEPEARMIAAEALARS